MSRHFFNKLTLYFEYSASLVTRSVVAYIFATLCIRHDKHNDNDNGDDVMII